VVFVCCFDVVFPESGKLQVQDRGCVLQCRRVYVWFEAVKGSKQPSKITSSLAVRRDCSHWDLVALLPNSETISDEPRCDERYRKLAVRSA
jgi:hypothetical protein